MSGFRLRWSDLTKEGWRSRLPTGLSNSYTYLKPGKTKKDVRGVDYFVGEEELMKYLDRKRQRTLNQMLAVLQNCMRINTRRKSSPGCETTVAREGDKTTATSGLSTAVDTNLDGAPYDDQAASYGESVSPTLRYESPHVTHRESQSPVVSSGSNFSPSPRRNLREEFDNEENETRGEVDGSRNEVPSNEEIELRRLAITAADNSDVNVYQDIDNPDDFTAMVSDAENDDGASGDEECVEEETNSLDGSDDNEEDAIEDAVFNKDFLEAAGGIAGITRSTVNATVLKDMSLNGWTDPVSFAPYPYLDQPYEARSSDSISTDFPNLYRGDYGPSTRALEAASTVIGSFFYFVQPQLWNSITEASNDYFLEKIDERVEGQYQKQLVRERKQPRYRKNTREDIKTSLLGTPDISARELCVFIGLLIARTIAPNKEKLEHHWRTTDDGAIPRGRFGLYMTRDRFMHISRNLHFSNNAEHRAVSDRAWKLRPVIDALQERFKSGYRPPPVMAFDEAMLPSRSSFNRMRVYMKDKPHKWGTKLFMLCCSSSAYCIRYVRIYCGKTQTGVSTAGTDAKSGPAAVVRNLKEVFGCSGSREKRLIVTDRFYTSPTLAMQLLTLGFYTIGTVMTNRQGFCKAIVEKKKKRPSDVLRGTYTVAYSTIVPGIKADRVVRREKSGVRAEIACPRILKDYQTFMGGGMCMINSAFKGTHYNWH
ncbi:hypothetical protein PPTG_06780 [Phytophthora nicotianae INRA-310]|uniref:PiggyBac transposable element-derived protein domain-containing protein n=1 Tax=Phytophthora nicotianae (strain INRA-310) TaxID=761204 RepID=W2QRD7_PHYN3|nr:hypothetical protein PPTG_06780 [Phytophthora nicotianae INRA-310]ETN15516.1 hypothetical protein PPTG_06780 [Phytophthora nicotianae INRA-310]